VLTLAVASDALVPKFNNTTVHVELMFWICTACGGADVIRILNFDEQDDSEDEKKNNKDST